ncbi:MAG: transglutaminase-like domain-containing protein [Pirellulales bacterium]
MVLQRLVSIIPIALIAILVVSLFGCETSLSQPSNPSVKQPEEAPVTQAPLAGQPSETQEAPKSDSFVAYPRSVYSEEVTWAAIVQQGQKTGYSLEKTRHFDLDGTSMVETVTEEFIEIKRLQQTIAIRVKNRFLETAAGKLVSYQTEMTQGPISSSFSGKISADGKNLTIQISTSGQKISSTIDWKPDWGGLYAARKILEDKPPKLGEKRTVTALVPLLNQACVVQYEAVGKEEVTMLDGSKVVLMKVINKVTPKDGNSIQTIFWINDQGQPIKTKAIGQNIEIFKCSEQFAKSPNELIEFDLAADTIVPVKEDLSGIHNKNHAVYRITLAHAQPDQVFPARSNQYFKKIDKQTIDLHVQRMSIDQPLDTPEILQVAPVPEDSTASPLIQINNKKIIAMSQGVLPNEKSAAVIALAMEKYVHEVITAKNFSTGFASAADVAEHLEGDCTEHSVLLTALLRARKIPARTAMGLVYFEFPTSKGFAYHMWTEAWVNDRWFPLDATMGRGGIGPGHIKVGDSNLAGAGAFAAFLPVSQVIGQVKIKAVLIE